METLKPDVQVVIINWKRPRNVGRIVEAFRTGTYPVKILIADCHPSSEFSLSPETKAKVDGLITIRDNLGPGSRFVPAFAYAHTADYTYFHDDDALPGPRIIESFVYHTTQISDFSVLGQQGRIFRIRHSRLFATYIANKILRRHGVYRPVDTTVRFHFIKNEYLPLILKFQQEWRRKLPTRRELLVEDDLLLNLSIQYYTQQPSYLIPQDNDPSDNAHLRSLHDPHAHSSRAWHKAFRREFVKLAYKELGWRRPIISPQSIPSGTRVEPKLETPPNDLD